ncbi:hypothetical protein NAT51_10865 [Flavobacterium amniphilum]|uniref:hypothetical protein n=1 Tax=Flavobacterium amniphilum TaxID=1834035 RepID=UPI00202A36B6|nr:hypothetical protein [Flavobacterium amniphilum]MCL9806028.1 hypothetical protein [Flavobacterium amniphilum]
MNQTTERGYGARIGNAAKLVQALESFNNYQPQKPELSIAGISEQIAAIRNLNNEVASKKLAYSLAVENRLQIFDKNQDSIRNILSPINANVKVSYGKNSKQAKDVAHIIKKMRGKNIAKANANEGNSISQSYQSFHSKTQFFADLVATISTFGSDYCPVNPKLNEVSLKDLYDNAVAANNLIVESNAKFVLINEKRIDAYFNLSQNAIGVKESIKAQFGPQSVEYRIVKGLYI